VALDKKQRSITLVNKHFVWV